MKKAQATKGTAVATDGRVFSPEAHREPSGDTVTVLMYPVWPTRLVRSLQLVRFHTLTILSQPPDTMMGLEVTGEKRTQLTHPVCASESWIVYLHSPRVFHSLMVRSLKRKEGGRMSVGDSG
jgi:hypothetical protein